MISRGSRTGTRVGLIGWFVSFLYQSAARLRSPGKAMPGQGSRMGAVWNGWAAAMPKSGNVMPEIEYRHRCTKVSPGVQTTPGS